MGGWHQLLPKNPVVIVDRQEMAGRLALPISKDSGCYLGSLADGWENTSCIRTPKTKHDHEYNDKPFSTHKNQNPITWLAVAISKHRVFIKSPENGWEMAVWLPQTVFKDCGGNSRSLQDG